MKNKLEKQLFKEAKNIEIKDSFSEICSSIGLESSQQKNSFWTKPKIISFSSVGCALLVAAILIPTLTINSKTNTDSYVSLTISSSDNVLKKSKVSDNNIKETTTASFSFYLDKELNIKDDNVFSFDDNSKVITCGIDTTSMKFENYLASLLDSAIKTGYINIGSTDGNYFTLLVSSPSKKTTKKVKNLLSSAIIDRLSENYIYGFLVDELSKATSEDEIAAENLGIELDKYLLIKRINELYEGKNYSIEALASLDYDSLVSLINSYYMYDYSSNFTTVSVEEQLDTLRKNYNESMSNNFSDLSKLQGEINQIQDYIHKKYHGNGYSMKQYREYMEYDYMDELFYEAIEKNLDYRQLVLLPHEKPEYTPLSGIANKDINEILEMLKNKVESSKNEVQQVISELIDFKAKEKNLLDQLMTDDQVEQVNKNFEHMYHEKVDDYNYEEKKKDKDQSWKSDYDDFFKDKYHYWR